MHQQIWLKFCLMFILCLVTGWTTAVRAIQDVNLPTLMLLQSSVTVENHLTCHRQNVNQQLSHQHRSQQSPQFGVKETVQSQHTTDRFAHTIKPHDCVHHDVQAAEQNDQPVMHQSAQHCQDCIGWHCLTSLALAPEEMATLNVIKLNINTHLYSDYHAQWSAGYLSDVLRPPQHLI